MSEAIKPTLLPCPFCGGTPSHDKTMDEDIWSHNTVPWRRVRCAECEIGTDYVCEGYDPSEVEAWNRRNDPLVERVKELEEAAADFMEAQAALDNREGMGINAEPYEVLMRRRNAAWDDLEAALSKALPNTVAEVKE